MGICISKPNELTEYLQKKILTYPGSRVYMSQLIIQWVWKYEYDRIFEYIREEDPLNLKGSMYNIKYSLDCAGRYKKKIGKPFLSEQEQIRYDLIMKERQRGMICNHQIKTRIVHKKTVEFIEDCKII